MASSTTTVRISQEAREALRELSRATGHSARELLERSLRAYRDQLLLEEANAAYAALRADEGAWREERDERAAWEGVIGDGLEREPSPRRTGYVGGPGPGYGEVWLADLDPVRGREQAGRRQVLVVSPDRFNHGPAGLVIVVPLTSRDRRIPLRVPIDPPEGGLRERSFAICEMVRSISRERLVSAGPWGAVSRTTMHRVADRLRLLLPAPA